MTMVIVFVFFVVAAIAHAAFVLPGALYRVGFGLMAFGWAWWGCELIAAEVVPEPMSLRGIVATLITGTANLTLREAVLRDKGKA